MNPITECPTEDLQSFVDDMFSAERSEQIIRHLDDCAACRLKVDELAGAAEDWAVAAEALSSEELPSVAFSDEDAVVGQFDISTILSLLTPSDDPSTAGRIGPFEVTGIVGSGGMAVVLKAREPSLDRFVAIKMLAPHLSTSSSARKRFAREARAAAAVIHDNVIAIYQVAHWNDVPYLVMPYLSDPSLQQRIDAEGPLEVEPVLSIAMQIARGLSAAHSQGLVHRDVKPANVLLSKGTERAVITDFGLARAADDASLTRVGTLAGTPHYMSPEQARGERVDASSDLFSFGSLMFTMLAGRPPADLEIGSETIAFIGSRPLPSLRDVQPDVPVWLTKMVDWLHQRDPSRRPASAAEVAHLLEQCLLHWRQPQQNALPDRLTDSSSNLTRKVAGVGAIFICVAVIVAGLFLASQDDEPITSQELGSGSEVIPYENQVPEDASPSKEGAVEWSLGWSDLDTQVTRVESDLQRLEVRLENDWSQVDEK